MIRIAPKKWIEKTFNDLIRQMRWTFLPPILVYLAAGLSGLTSIVGTFFVKEYLDLSAAFLASLAFWAGIPWALKMPIGHLVDLLWRWKSWIIYFGAGLIALNSFIMFCLIAHAETMRGMMGISKWFVLSSLLAPIGYVIQDAVADAMTVEAVSSIDDRGRPYTEEELKSLHTTMQTLGRFAIVSGLVAISCLNIFMFSGIEDLTEAEKADIYAKIFLLALVVPLISVTGVLLNEILQRKRARKYRELGFNEGHLLSLISNPESAIEPNWWILGGSLVFVAFTLTMGLSKIPLSQEIVFAGSMAIVVFLILQLIKKLDVNQAKILIGTATIIFVFRAVPLPGAGATWFEIDKLGFDQQFLSVLSLLTACLALLGMIVLRPLMATKSIAYIVVLLTILAVLLSLPNIGLYYSLHHWTESLTRGVVDARFIAIIDAAIESPLGQIAMIPMLAWIARNAPKDLKATFFAVMASFTNLALSASSLGTKYLNQLFIVRREVKDPDTGMLEATADYSELGLLLIVTAVIAFSLPMITVLVIQNSSLRTND